MASFRINGDRLKIMVFADLQDDEYISAYTLKFMNAALDAENPDLVVLGGDNLAGYAPGNMLREEGAKNSITALLGPIVDRSIPFALVFGNHDQEAAMPKEKQMEHYLSFNGCIAEKGIIGSSVGNYRIGIEDKNGDTFLYLWFMDTNYKAMSEYGYGFAGVSKEQIEWFDEESARLARENAGKIVKGLMFEHVPVPEIYGLLTQVDASHPQAVRGHGRLSKQFYILSNTDVTSGVMLETPSVPDINNGQFESWLRNNNIIAAFFGHDHKNSFSGVHKGIRLAYTPGSGFGSYGYRYLRGVRVIEADALSRSVKSRIVFYRDVCDEEINRAILYIGEKNAYIRQWATAGPNNLIRSARDRGLIRK
ncbi:MAG: metallophosphoesterase family protein [Eubacteriaceae bacterium]|nr:metallophosphoesterase family protein [Eubacteriaceae bacterium]